MKEFFTSQLDYIFFFCGLAFIVLASVCLMLHKQEKLRLPWQWLCLFGLVHGLGEWLDLSAIVFGDNRYFSDIRVTIMAVSFVFLFEFGRAGLAGLKIWIPGRWIYMPLAGIIAAGMAIEGMLGFQIAVRYELGLIGGILTAFTFARAYQQHRHEHHHGYLLVAAASTALYAVAAGLVVPNGTFFPASALNYAAFSDYFSVPIQLVRGILAASLAMAIGFYTPQSRPDEKRLGFLFNRPYTIISMLVILATLVGGWFFTTTFGKDHETINTRALKGFSLEMASSIDPLRAASLAGSAADCTTGNYRSIKQQLQTVKETLNASFAGTQCRFVYLMGLRNNRVVFLADAEPEDSADNSPPGQIYEEASKELIASFSNGKPFLEGPLTDRWGTWISSSVPLRDSYGNVTAILGIDFDANLWQRQIAIHRFEAILAIMLVNIIFLTSMMTINMLRTDAANRHNFLSALANSERRYGTLVENLNVGIYRNSIDNGGRFFDINLAYAKLLGYDSVEEIKDIAAADIYVNPEDCARYLEKIKSQGSVKNEELQFHKKDGAIVSVSITAQAHFDHNGEIKWIDGIAEDITERKQKEDALRDSRERLNLALRSAKMGIFEWDIVNNKRIWDDNVHLLLALAPGTYSRMADDFLNIVHPDDRKNVQAALARAADGKEGYETEYRAIWP
ncbi:MAG: PAS domain-containing protein, partial [Sedimentisphaerales bacterium]|nr:PAS domain-containing protein [Sedimentisphaerales bacterium]